MLYSVLMSVYKNEKVPFFREAVDSVLNQTERPDQIVLVRDGEVYEELQAAIDSYVSEYPEIFTYVPLEVNGGLGNALRVGLLECRNEFVGRMDTDDICLPDRFEQQLRFFEEHPDVDIVGGNISEFCQSPEHIVDYRIVPEAHDDIVKYLKSRSPMNHVTVMFKKSTLLAANSYESFYLFEDWYLWTKLYLNGARFANLSAVLVNVRVLEMANRRGGMKYYKSCVKLLKFMKANKVIGTFAYLKTSAVRFIGYVLMPSKLREWAYKKLLREKQLAGEAQKTAATV